MKPSKKRLTIHALSMLVNKSDNTLRRDAQQGICPYIVASKPKGKKSYTYYINITALREFEGKDVLKDFYDDQLAAENQDN